MTAPGSFSAGDVLTAADMNGLTSERYDYSATTGDFTITTTYQVIATYSFTLTSTRLVMFHWHVPFIDSVSGATALYNDIGESLTGSSSGRYQQTWTDPATNSASGIALRSLDAGSHTVYWTAATNSGSCRYNGITGRLNLSVVLDTGAI